MFVSPDDTVDLVDNPEAPVAERTVLTFRRRINLGQQGKLWADDILLRNAQDGALTTVQQYMLYLQAYLVRWSGPTIPCDADGQPVPVRDELVAQMDYADPFVYRALKEAERLYMAQFLTKPEAPAPKADRPTRRTRKR